MFVAFIPQKKHIIKKIKKVIYLKNKHIITNCISTIVYMIFLQYVCTRLMNRNLML
jgi:hypothetical protein